MLHQDAADARADAEEASVSSFDRFYRDNYGAVVRLAYVLSGSWGHAEEIAQDAFVRVLARWDGSLSVPEGWVRQVAANLARSRLRRLGAEVRAYTRWSARRAPPSTMPDPIPPELERFWAVVRALPTRQAQAVALYYLEDRPVVEVAAVMGCAPGTVKALLHRARQRMADDFGTGAGR